MGRPNATGTKIRDQDLVATKDVQRKKAVTVVETIEVASILIAVGGIIGGIVVQNDLAWWLVKALQECVVLLMGIVLSVLFESIRFSNRECVEGLASG